MDRRTLLTRGAALGAGVGVPVLLTAGRALAQVQVQTLPPPGSASQPYSNDPGYPSAQPGPSPAYPSSAYPQPAYPANAGGYQGGPAPMAPPSGVYPPASPGAYNNGANSLEPADAQVRPPSPPIQPQYPVASRADTYSREEIANSVSDFLGVTAEAAGAAVERVFRENGRPTGYIAGEEVAVAFTGGLRYGKGLLYMKNRTAGQVYWQGPSIGFDIGINGSRVFTLCYNLQYPEAILRRFPGVEGSAYFIGGLGVNYQRAEDIVLAPMRAGVGFRLGANIGYLAYSRQRNWIPL